MKYDLFNDWGTLPNDWYKPPNDSEKHPDDRENSPKDWYKVPGDWYKLANDRDNQAASLPPTTWKPLSRARPAFRPKASNGRISHGGCTARHRPRTSCRCEDSGGNGMAT